MKKLFLILFISLGLIGPANANSIEGAFGYKLGQVVKDVKTEVRILFENTDQAYIEISSNKDFIPKKPLPGKHTYSISTTLEDKKIWGIHVRLIRSPSDDNFNDCQPDYGYFRKIVEVYEAKYGEFNKTRDDGERYSGLTYSFTKGKRNIRISCSREVLWNKTGYYNFGISYFDYKLRDLATKEEEKPYNEALKKMKQKIIEESKEYDI